MNKSPVFNNLCGIADNAAIFQLPFIAGYIRYQLAFNQQAEKKEMRFLQTGAHMLNRRRAERSLCGDQKAKGD
jgi:hypothetical protein